MYLFGVLVCFSGWVKRQRGEIVVVGNEIVIVVVIVIVLLSGEWGQK